LTKIQKLKVKINVWSIKIFKHIPPFSGIYTEQAYQLQDIQTLSICIEALANSIKALAGQIKEIQDKLKISSAVDLDLTPRDKTKLN
jgi:hypothetical protein